MPLVNWPPAGVPTPPFESSSLEAAVSLLRYLKQKYGWDTRNPTNAERNAIFDPARCSQGHTVTGLMVVAPDGTLYPFARCNAPAQQTSMFLMLWEPYEYPEP